MTHEEMLNDLTENNMRLMLQKVAEFIGWDFESVSALYCMLYEAHKKGVEVQKIEASPNYINIVEKDKEGWLAHAIWSRVGLPF